MEEGVDKGTNTVKSELLSRKRVFAAVKALKSYLLKEGTAEEDSIALTIAIQKVPGKRQAKPRRIPLKHPLYASDDIDVCFIVKDPQRSVKDYLEKNGRHGVSKVLGISKLRQRYKTFEAKRELCSSYDLFLADDRVLPLLPKLLGKEFFRSKKIPSPVNMQRDIGREIDSSLKSTFLHIGTGPYLTVKVGPVSFKSKQVTDNILVAFDSIVRKLPGGIGNIQAVHVKSTNSVALPIYNQLPVADLSYKGPDLAQSPS